MASKRLARTEPKARMEVDSVWRMIYNKVKGYKRSQRKPHVHSRSIAPSAVTKYEHFMEAGGLKPEEIVEDEEFFDIATSTSPKGYPLWQPPPREGKQPDPVRMAKQTTTQSKPQTTTKPTKEEKKKEHNGLLIGTRRGRETRSTKPIKLRQSDDDDDDEAMEALLGFFNNSDRKQAGLGFVARLIGGAGPKMAKDWKPRRPFFTWWVTIIQLVVYIVSMIVYGIAPIGISQTEISDEVLMTSMVVEQVSYFESDNMWIGPREEDLIHLGAKYSPCMRVDDNVEAAIAMDQERERNTACCVRNDGSGCVQSQEIDCPTSISTWVNWTSANPGYQDRTSGAVCGQDPEYCLKPASAGAFIWPDDLTQWPICEEASNVTQNENNYHMTCEVVGRPCCVGIQGECLIATREYCDFRKGYFHDDATLCSQVECMNEICGMISFLNPEKADQFYRLLFSQFLHAGLFTMVITLLFQFTIMRDLERIIGWWRIAIIYLGSGVTGSLGSAIFLPYHVEAGPAGSQFGVLAALYIEVIRWNQKGEIVKTIVKLTVALVLFFIIGLLPMIDNWAHLFGFGFGYLFTIGCRPYKILCKNELSTPARVLVAFLHLILAAVLFAILIVLFYVSPVYECDTCKYFNCIPFTATFCKGMEIEIGRSYEL